jgi:hypothetical protein
MGRREGRRREGRGGKEETEVWEGRERGDVCIHPSGGSEALLSSRLASSTSI